MKFPSFDTELLLLINHSNNILLDGVMLKFSDTWTWSFLILVILFIVFRDRPVKEAFLILLGIGLCVLFADQISSTFLKPWVARYRPTHDPELMFQVRHIAGRMGEYGFVSSHAANTFAVGTFLSYVFRHRITSICLMIWASIVSLSRVYLGVHFPLDILCGGLLGVLVGLFVYMLFRLAVVRILQSPQQYYSSAYTRTGFTRDNMHIFLTAMAITLVYTFI